MPKITLTLEIDVSPEDLKTYYEDFLVKFRLDRLKQTDSIKLMRDIQTRVFHIKEIEYKNGNKPRGLGSLYSDIQLSDLISLEVTGIL